MADLKQKHKELQKKYKLLQQQFQEAVGENISLRTFGRAAENELRQALAKHCERCQRKNLHRCCFYKWCPKEDQPR